MISRNQYKMTNTEVCSLTTNLKELQEKSGKSMPMFDANKKQKGELSLAVNLQKIQNFGDYLKAGYHVQLMGAIDFTYSNGNVASPQSLHYTGEQGNN